MATTRYGQAPVGQTYTDEQWSRILSAHAGEQLKRYGTWWNNFGACISFRGCVNQVAFLIPSPEKAIDRTEVSGWAAECARCFDSRYDPWMSPEMLIDLLDPPCVA